MTTEVRLELRRALLLLAKREEDEAAAEASRVPYWVPCPASVQGHRAAARALRLDADRLLDLATA